MIITININQPTTDYTWALISKGVVVNIIFADINFINNSGINLQYDFIVNLVSFIQPISAGWFYNSDQNTFSAPLVDPNQILGQDVANLYDVLRECLVDSQGANIATVISNIETINAPLTAGSVVLWNAIKTWLLAGGN